MADDPTYHTKIPEYNESRKALDEHYAKRLDQLEADRRAKTDYLQEQLMMRNEYTNKQYEVRNSSSSLLIHV